MSALTGTFHRFLGADFRQPLAVPGDSTPTVTEASPIVRTADILGGKPRIAGRRIAVQHIAIWRNQLGMSVDEIAEEYDLSPEDVHAALAYYQGNQAAIDADIREEEALITEVERQAKPRVRQ